MKTCRKCHVSKDIEEFPRAGRNGRQSQCKRCWADYMRNWSKSNPERMHSHHLKRYSLSLGDYADLLESQGGVCAICGAHERVVRRGRTQRLSVDHDHASGAIRGLLCNNCNNIIGRAADRTDILEQAVAYLERSVH